MEHETTPNRQISRSRFVSPFCACFHDKNVFDPSRRLRPGVTSYFFTTVVELRVAMTTSPPRFSLSPAACSVYENDTAFPT